MPDVFLMARRILEQRDTINALKADREQLLVGIECVLLEHAAELSGPNVDPNLADLAHRFVGIVGDAAPAEIRDALARAEDLASLCERCGGGPCTECGECAGQLCRECRCDQRDRDENEREGQDDD